MTATTWSQTDLLRELSPVVRIDERVIGTGVPGPVTRKLLAGYRRKAQELTRAMIPSALAAASEIPASSWMRMR